MNINFIKRVFLLCFVMTFASTFASDGQTIDKNSISSDLCISKSCTEKIFINITVEICSCYINQNCSSTIWDNAKDVSSDRFPLYFNLSPIRRGNDGGVNIGPRSAINLTCKIKDESVKGLAIRYMNNCWANNTKIVCRNYNWSSIPISSLIGKTLFDNEIIFDVEKHGAPCGMEIAAFSSSENQWKRVKYNFTILDNSHIEPNVALCDWRSLILVETASHDVEKRSLLITFSTVPSRFGVFQYKVLLMSRKKATVWETTLSNLTDSHKTVEVTNVEFNVAYQIIVSLISTNCPPSESLDFYLKPTPEYERKIYIYGVVLPIVYVLLGVFIFVLGAVFICAGITKCRMHRLLSRVGEPVKVFLVYCRDTEEHTTVVQRFAKYLELFCHCKVFLDEWDLPNKNPHDWVNNCLSSADYVIIIWSRGAKLKVQKGNNMKLKCDDSFLGNDFRNCLNKINASIEKEMTWFFSSARRRYINLYFPYVTNIQFSSCLSYLQHYQIPKDFNDLLYHLHQIMPHRYWNAVFKCFYPKLPFADLAKSEEGQKLLTAIQNMQQLDKDDDWFEERVVIDAIRPGMLLSADRDSLSSDEQLSDENGCSGNRIRTESSEVDDDDFIPPPPFPPDIVFMPIYGDNRRQFLPQASTQENPNSCDLPLEVFGP